MDSDNIDSESESDKSWRGRDSEFIDDEESYPDTNDEGSSVDEDYHQVVSSDEEDVSPIERRNQIFNDDYPYTYEDHFRTKTLYRLLAHRDTCSRLPKS